MSTEDLNRWTGYNSQLGNGNKGSLQFMEEHYDQGEISPYNNAVIGIDKVFNQDEIVIANQDEEQIEDRKILYCHPRRINYKTGFSAPVEYRGGTKGGGYGDRRIADSAVLIVRNEIPIKRATDLESVGTLLVGDSEDEKLEGEGISIQAYPMV